jgi:hypothetical protein
MVTQTDELEAIWASYVKAVDEHAEAASMLYTNSRCNGLPTAGEIQREADTRVIMVGARTAYFEARRRSASF